MYNMKKCAGRVKHPVKVVSLGLILSLCVNSGAIAEIGVTNDKIIIGGVMDLEGRSRGLGQGMREGIVAALSGQKVKGRSIEYVTLNDSYTPSKTIAATQDLVGRGIFAMLGNVGTPTAKVSLPLLERSGIPAVGFFTGAGLLRPGKGDVVNYRASYVQETAAVINAGLDSGLKANEICAYVQNDAYGMAGIAGVKAALKSAGGSKEVIQKLDEIIALGGDNPFRNNVGPVGVYKRNTFSSRDGYNSLKAWETNAGVKCRLVVTVGAYASIANFIGYATMKGEEWIYSAVSFTGAENLKNALAEFGVKENIIVTQVVPPLNSKLQVVKDARKVLGSKLNYVNLEGYVVGRFLLEALKKIPGKEITRDSLLSVINGNKFNIGGLALDYSNDNQGSDLVIETYLADDRFKIASAGDLKKLFR